MLLTDEKIDLASAEFQRENTENLTVSKPELRTAFTTVDGIIESLMGGAFGATELVSFSEKQKTDLFRRVIDKRWEAT